MPRNIKVVEINQNSEEPVEEVKEPEPIINEPITLAAAEANIEQEPVIELQEKPKVVRKPKPKAEKPKVDIQALDTINDEAITPATTKEIPEPPTEPPPEPPKRAKKPPATGTCNICGKTMLMKTLKYSHPKLCQTVKPEPKKKEKKELEPEIKPDFDGEVNFNANRPVEVKPIDLYNQQRQLRIQQKQARVKNLISKVL